MKKYCPYCDKVHEVRLTSHTRNTRSSHFIVHYYYCEENNVYFTDDDLSDRNHAAAEQALEGVYVC